MTAGQAQQPLHVLRTKDALRAAGPRMKLLAGQSTVLRCLHISPGADVCIWTIDKHEDMAALRLQGGGMLAQKHVYVRNTSAIRAKI